MDAARTATIASGPIRGRTPLKATISTNANGQHDDAFANYQALLWKVCRLKAKGAERFPAAFAPKTRLGLVLRNQVIKALRDSGPGSACVHRHPATTLIRLADIGANCDLAVVSVHQIYSRNF
jgi:hypothetical protein